MQDAANKFKAAVVVIGNQIEFVNLIVDHLTEHGAMNPELLYESPFSDLNPKGPEGGLNSAKINELIRFFQIFGCERWRARLIPDQAK